jgi:hypothetical protein
MNERSRESQSHIDSIVKRGAFRRQPSLRDLSPRAFARVAAG